MKKITFGTIGALLCATMVAGSSAVAGTYNYSGAIVDYTVPTSGTYAITAAGAQGGAGGLTNGGLGAAISGDVFLAAGAQLDIFVGWTSL